MTLTITGEILQHSETKKFVGKMIMKDSITGEIMNVWTGPIYDSYDETSKNLDEVLKIARDTMEDFNFETYTRQ